MSKKFPSFNYIVENAMSAFKRFPMTLICAINGTIFAVALFNSYNIEQEFVLQKLLLIFGLSLPIFIALTIIGEKQKWNAFKNIIIQFTGAALLVLYYFSFPKDPFSADIHIMRYFLLSIAFHSLVAFGPFLSKDQMNGFWQFNKSLFLRLLMTVLYSGVMYIGLTIALAAADYLFGVDVKPERYMQLWIIMAGLFHTWLFLAGIPKNLDELNSAEDYPKGLKVFTQYILLPLVILYFVILIAYEAKILATWNWPKGWVSELILWYAIVGILSLLLLYPLRDKSGNLWIQVFIKWFFRALIPLVVMLFLAIGQRISEYGLTVNRYFILMLAIALSVTTLYFIFSKAKDIRIIPILLFVIALFSSYGPQSAFSISKNNQIGRLNNLLIKSGLLDDNQLIEPTKLIDLDDQKNMSSIVDYLNDWHGASVFSIWLDENTINEIDSTARYNHNKSICRSLGFEFVNRWQEGVASFFYLASDKEFNFDITNYSEMIGFNFNPQMDSDYLDIATHNKFLISYSSNTHDFRIVEKSDPIKVIKIPVTDFINQLRKLPEYSKLGASQMILKSSNDYYDIVFYFENINGNYLPEELSVSHLEGFILINTKYE